MMKKTKTSVTLKDIALVLGMAHTTVSRALNDHPKISAETKERVRATALQIGYVANSGARAMRSGAVPIVGLIVPDVENEFYSAAARAMAQQCSARGYQLILGLSEDDPTCEEQHIRTMRESRAAGVLLVPSPAPTQRALDLLRHTPVVQLLRFNRKFGAARVSADDMDGTYRATEYLLGLGHRSIAFIGPPRGPSTVEGRVLGYEAALRRAGVDINPQLQKFGVTRPDFGRVAVNELLRVPAGPTAVVVASSRQVLGVLLGANACGLRIPEDLSIISYGDADWFQACQPGVTAMALPVSEISERATDLLFQMLDGESPTRAAKSAMAVEFKTEMVLRGSAGTVLRKPAASRRAVAE